jgi:hypothetical protein
MKGREASDRLSPIIVKELRQGVRGHLFTGAFLLQQLLLVGIASLGLAMDTNPGSREVFSFFFWAFVTIPLVLILPLGAAVSISGELAANTLEPLLLTRLTPWRLVAGKWAATASQALVLAAAALPFVLVRYYLGAVEIAQDLFFLAGYVCCSLLLASVAVAISPARLSALFRWVLMAVLGLVLGSSFMVVMGRAAYWRAVYSAPGGTVWPSLLAFMAVSLIGVLAALEASALQVAPAATARPMRLRMLALLALALAAWIGLQPADEYRVLAIVWALALAGAVAVAGLCEPAHRIRSRYAPFFRRRPFAPLGWFLAPGWPAGVGFVLLVASLAAVAALPFGGVRMALFVGGGLAGSLLLPLVVWRTLFRRIPALARNPRYEPSFPMFLLVTLVSVAFSTIAPVGRDNPAVWAAGCILLPLCPAAFAAARLGWHDGYGDGLATTIPFHADAIFVVVVCAVLAAALSHTVRAWREIGRLVRQPPA